MHQFFCFTADGSMIGKPSDENSGESTTHASKEWANEYPSLLWLGVHRRCLCTEEIGFLDFVIQAVLPKATPFACNPEIPTENHVNEMELIFLCE
jgi:hypothetical protein